MEKELDDCNIQSEMLFVGALVKQPDLLVNYSNFMRSKYDFSDPVTKFFYDSFETYYLTFSQTVDETKMNVFMSQNDERLKLYKQYKGWKTLQRYMSLADENDIKNYFDTVKNRVHYALGLIPILLCHYIFSFTSRSFSAHIV